MNGPQLGRLVFCFDVLTMLWRKYLKYCKSLFWCQIKDNFMLCDMNGMKILFEVKKVIGRQIMRGSSKVLTNGRALSISFKIKKNHSVHITIECLRIKWSPLLLRLVRYFRHKMKIWIFDMPPFYSPLPPVKPQSRKYISIDKHMKISIH